MKTENDIAAVRRAADESAERGITLVHQCHTQSLFETVDDIEMQLKQLDHPNFGLIFEAANLRRADRTTARIRSPDWLRGFETSICRTSD